MTSEATVMSKCSGRVRCLYRRLHRFPGAELAAVHIHTAPPDHTVYAQLIALINMIIHHGGQRLLAVPMA